MNHISDTIYGDNAFNRKGDVSHELLKTLLYFDIFQYPVTAKELKKFCGTLTTLDRVEYELVLLEKSNYIEQKDEFYAIAGRDITSTVERRIKGNRTAAAMLKIAHKYIKLVSYFPFVRGIYLSGSLSKGYADENSDVDYFIITEPERLWLCRTLLVLFKKVFLFNSRKYFCVNYFITTNNLEIMDRNIFTATEMATLIPTCNFSLYRKLMQSNLWVKEYFPNTMLETIIDECMPENTSLFKRAMEKLFPGKLGDKMDSYCLTLTLQKWRRKFGYFSEKEFELNMRSQKNVSKHHPHGFQLKVVSAYNEKLTKFEQKFQSKLN